MFNYLFFAIVITVLGSVVDPMSLQAGDSDNHESKLLEQTLDFAKGHQDFKNLHFKQHEAEFIRLVKEGQAPQILLITCSDSRIVPDLILNTNPGDLFVVRNAGNFVPPSNFQEVDGVGATIQYAVEALNVKHIIVCGHSHCGAIEALYKTIDPEKLGMLKRWIKFGEPAKRTALLATKQNESNEDIYPITEKISVIYQLENLMSFPFIKTKVDAGLLELHAWYFKIETGEIWYYNPEQFRFIPLLSPTMNSPQNLRLRHRNHLHHRRQNLLPTPLF